MNIKPRISFGIIVLNGEPFIRYNLRSLYPYAHQIIVVEGACQAAADVATSEGHSIDHTLESIRQFKADEDFENKVILVTARDEGYTSGFWPEKTEMCRAFAKRATGSHLWQVDSDEFYLEEDMPVVFDLLQRKVGWIAFPQHSFWGGIDYVNGSLALTEFDLQGAGVRLFSWGEGYQYVAHRPPTVLDADGRNVRMQGQMTSRQLKRLGIYRYHYSLVFPSQVLSKVHYYKTPSQEKKQQKGGYNQNILSWHESNFLQITRPYHMHNIQGAWSWIRSFRAKHPLQVLALMADIRAGRLHQEVRLNEDVENLLRSWLYRLTTTLLTVWVALCTSPWGYPVFCKARSLWRRLMVVAWKRTVRL